MSEQTAAAQVRPPTLSQIVEQLRACGYGCVAGALENNTHFRALAERAEADELDRARVRGALDAGGFFGREVESLTCEEALSVFNGELLRQFTTPLKDGRRLGLLQCENGYVLRLFNPVAANQQQGVHVNLSGEAMAWVVQAYLQLAEQDDERHATDLEALVEAIDTGELERLNAEREAKTETGQGEEGDGNVTAAE